jgi:hypothetical protein
MWTGGSRPWRTTDGADSWQVAGPDFAGPGRISAIAVSVTDSDVLYLGFENGYVVRSLNATSASPSWEIFANGLYGGWVSSVAVDPDDPDVAYCTYSNYGIPHVLRTTDGGSSWHSIDGIGSAGVPDIPVHWIDIRPCAPQQLYVGTELGVFASDDGGSTWQPANPGLPNTVVESLDFQSYDQLVAFTHGRGAFRTDLSPCDCVTRNGDLDGDDTVGPADYVILSHCLGGPKTYVPGSVCHPCDFGNSDLDADGDVDLGDFAAFQRVSPPAAW